MFAQRSAATVESPMMLMCGAEPAPLYTTVV